MDIKEHLVLDPAHSKCPTRDHPEGKVIEQALPLAKATKLHPIKAGGENARLFFVGNATTILYVWCIVWCGVAAPIDVHSLGNGRGPDS